MLNHCGIPAFGKVGAQMPGASQVWGEDVSQLQTDNVVHNRRGQLVGVFRLQKHMVASSTATAVRFAKNSYLPGRSAI